LTPVLVLLAGKENSQAQVADLTQQVQELNRKSTFLADENAKLQQGGEDSQGDLKAKLANVEILLAQKEAQIAELQSGYTIMRRDEDARKPAEVSLQRGSEKQFQTLTEECERWKAKFQESEVKQVQLYNEIQKLEAEKAALLDPERAASASEPAESKKKGVFSRGARTSRKNRNGRFFD
jgi:uncharacterized protein HemX